MRHFQLTGCGIFGLPFKGIGVIMSLKRESNKKQTSSKGSTLDVSFANCVSWWIKKGILFKCLVCFCLWVCFSVLCTFCWFGGWSALLVLHVDKLLVVAICACYWLGPGCVLWLAAPTCIRNPEESLMLKHISFFSYFLVVFSTVYM